VLSPGLKYAATRSGCGQLFPRFASLLAVVLLVLACAPEARASYGQMRLDGLSFFLAVTLLYVWSFPLTLGLGLRWSRYRFFVVAATVVTVALVSLLIAFFNDGRATMLSRPLGSGGMFVVLLLASLPVMLAAPFLQRAWLRSGKSGRLPVALLVGILLFVPAGSLLHQLLQDRLEHRALAQARALTPGRILPHLIAARQRTAHSWLSPYLWTEQAELQWMVIGLGRLDFIESPVPLSSEDTQALELLVRLSPGTEIARYTWTLTGKLIWDRFLGAAPGDRFAVAADLSRQQASQFNEYIGVPHADWLCTPLDDPETLQAFEQLWTLLTDHERERFSAAVLQKCGTRIGPPGN